uniref:Endonuclease n=1 Tax=Cyprinus carpio carpio TaxID=630221 RepID=A0A9J7XBE8_CYPCA
MLKVGHIRRYGESAASESEETSIKHKADDTTYIRIPLTKLLNGPPEEITKKKTDNNVIKNKQCYVMSYNNEKKNAEWVYEIMNRSTLPSHYKTPQFQDSGSDSDSDDPSYQAPNSSNAFSNTDYDRGHLAAVANHMWCQEAYKDTYWMSNITPQNENLNKGTWKSLENQCRDIVKDDNVRNVHVYTGPLYMRKELKKDNVDVLNISEMKYVGRKAVPTHYFKVVIVEHNNGTVEEPECILIANEAKQHWEQMDIKSIERISGLKFTEDSPELAECRRASSLKSEHSLILKITTLWLLLAQGSSNQSRNVT